MRALVLAGGGMRAAYASGVAHALQDAGERFDAVYGTSAGGAMGAWFTAGQAELGTRTFAFATDPVVLNFRRYLLRRGPLLDLDHLFWHVYPALVGFDVDRLRKAHNPAYVTAAEVESGLCHYFDVRKVADPFLVLKATSALPFVTSGPVRMNGGHYLDGGIVEPVPVRRAIEDGADDILVVFNRTPGPVPSEPRAVTWMAGRRYPMLYAAMKRHHALYHEAQTLIASPPPGVRVQVLAPKDTHGVTRLTRDQDRIGRLLESGRADARALLDGAVESI
ncbi:MAG: patatin family protein [Euryarchaeota archaeon]|nr:patatin family protein [Euryarchaeota archaeon]